MPGEHYKLLYFNKSYNYLVSSTIIIFCIGSIHLLDIEKYASIFEILFCYLFIFKYTKNIEKKISDPGFSLPLLRAEMKPHLSTRSWGHPDLQTVIAVQMLEHLEEPASGLRGGAGSQLGGG